MARILIAEDEPRISSFVSKGLSSNGYAVSVVEDGLTAYDYACTGEFDLMILDIGLPGLDGIEVCRQLRVFSDAYVVMLTARGGIADRTGRAVR